MVGFTVYQAAYTTRAGSQRFYIGYTASVDLRKFWHQMEPPAWMKPRVGDKLEVIALESGIPSRELARAAEAIWAARKIKQKPLLTRGGPWAKPTWKDSWTEEVAKVSVMRSILQLGAYAEQQPKSSPLHNHLDNLSFHAASEAKRSEAVCRGAVARRVVRKSGTPGNKNRASQIRRGVLKRGSAWHRRVHRGKYQKRARKRETLKRRPR